MALVSPEKFGAVLFDLDGVITASAEIHAAAWKQAFDAVLRKREGESFRPFDAQADYEQYVDGLPRFDGARSFLRARQIELPDGDIEDDIESGTVWAVANRKDEIFRGLVKTEHVRVYEGTVRWIGQLRAAGIRIAVVSSSRHCEMLLSSAGLTNLFDVRVDGNAAARMKLRGKPEPDTFLKAAEVLGVEPERAVVVEDALAGVAAGRKGGFGLVIGVDRKHDAEALRRHGADVVVSDLEEMVER